VDFEDTAEEAEFRAGARTFLEQNARRREPGSGLVYRAGNESPEFRLRAKQWQAKKADAGYAGITWSKEWGGRGGSAIEQVIYDQEEAKYAVPRGLFDIGLGMCIPTLCTWGTQAHRDRYARKALRGEEVWCQLFSEPAAGSDLAGLRTRAVPRGNEWVINGQKVWTSMAHLSQWCFVVARTEKGSKRHAGLSYLLVPLDQPGVEIRPIVQLTGTADFNEVFFDDARTDADLVVGEPGDGWRVAMGTLTFERGVSTLGQQIRYARELSNLVELAKQTGADDDPLIRERLTRSWVGLQTMRSYALATTDVEQPGQDNVSKLLWANWHRDLGELAMDIVGKAGLVAKDGEFDVWQHLYLFTRADTIYGGSNEIQRNIIAERVLGLPREVKGS
jgi:alkylation response protein AidB-like acyl-CoA dehydrogenase